MAENVTEKNCELSRKPIEEKLLLLFTKYDKLSSKMNWFYILAISTLIAVIINLIKIRG